jgi:divalent metal cation (Fe/Co/Zn/Cd) transporter
MTSGNAIGAHETEFERLRWRAIRLEYFTVAWMLAETVVALVAGVKASSIALVGFGLDSVMETVSGVALLWRFKQRRLDERHAESRAVRVVGITFLALGAYVAYEAATDLWFRRAPQSSLPGMVLAVAALLVMPALGIAKRRLAASLKSSALAADSLETFACAYLSGALLVGLALNGWLGWRWTDPVAGLAMSAFMIREGVEILKESES